MHIVLQSYHGKEEVVEIEEEETVGRLRERAAALFPEGPKGLVYVPAKQLLQKQREEVDRLQYVAEIPQRPPKNMPPSRTVFLVDDAMTLRQYGIPHGSVVNVAFM